MNFRRQLGEGPCRGSPIHQGFLQVLLLRRVEIVLIVREYTESLCEQLLAALADLPLAQSLFQAFAASLQGLKDRFGTGGQTALQGGQGEADRTFPLTIESVSLTHFGTHILGHSFIEHRFTVRQWIVDGIGAAFREQRRPIKPHQFLLHHPPHQVGHIHLMHSIPELAIEAIRVQQRQEQLKILFLAIVRGSRHQQQVAGMRPNPFRELEALRPLDLLTEEMR